MKKKILVMCIAASVMSTACVQASTVNELKYDMASQTLTVSGTADAYSDTDYREVGFELYAPGKSAADAANLIVFDTSVLEQFAQITPGANGAFSYSYKLDTMNYGNHIVTLTFADGTSYSDYLFLTTIGEDTALKNAANAANTKEKMLEVFSNYDYLFYGLNCYAAACDLMTEEELKADIAQKMSGMTFADSDMVCREIQKAAVVAGLEKMDTPESFKEWAEKWKSELGFSDDTIYTMLYPLSSDAVTDELISMNFASVQNFYNSFCEKVILDAINKTVNYKDVEFLINNAKHYLVNSDLDTYYTLSDTAKVTVQKAVLGAYSSVSELEAKLKSEIRKAKANSVYNNSGSGSSGGSGGGSSYSTSVGVNNSIIAKNPEATSVEKPMYNDLDSVSWAKESIERLGKKGIISGTGDNMFRPQDNITREEFVKMIVCAYNLLDENAKTDDFDDVDSSKWYAKYVASAYNAKIIFGINEKDFGVGEFITREDMAVIACRAANIAAGNTEVKFSDDENISDYAKDAVYAMKASGIMQGKGNNLFEPKAYATRAETAKMLDTMLKD